MPSRLSVRFVTVCVFLVGCGTSAPAAPRPRASGEIAEASESVPAVGNAEARPAAAATGPERVVLDLVAHQARAERWLGRTRVFDLRGPGAAKYTVGGFGSDLDVGEAGALAKTARVELRVPGGVDGPASIVVSADASLREIALDGTTLPPRDGAPGEVVVDTLGAGEHTLRVQGARPGFVLREVRVGPRGEIDRRPVSRPVDGAIALVAGERLGYTLEVPRGARLRTEAHGDVVVEARDDAGHASPIGAGSNGALDLDLGRLAGETVRIELTARGDATLRAPRIVTAESSASAPRTTVRNVVVVLVDTWRADKLRAYRAESRVETPALDAFAARSTVFSAAHSQECWTKPSVATLLSGLFPWEHTAVESESLVPASVKMLPEILSERGFQTAAFIANGYVSDRFGFGRGWSRYTNYLREGKRTRAEDVIPDVIRFLDARDASKPFFLYVHTIDPHVPYRPHEGIFSRYGDPEYRGPVTFARDAMLLEKIKLGQLRIGERDRAQLEALYDNEITYHDVHFGQLIEALTRRGLDDDTLVVVTSDHGEEFFDHGSVGHGHSLYEELVHVPLFVRVPGRAPTRLEVPVGLVDLAPTIFDLLGLENAPATSGRSLASMLRGDPETAPRAAVSGFMDHQRSVVVGRWKLIHRLRGRYALYDLATDPHEAHDVAADHPLAVELTRGMLGLELARAGGPAPRGTTGPRPARAQHEAERTTIDPATEAQLRAIGYAN